ncbi:AraC family transcriptional regulator [Paenibacillus sp. LHD-117]|uniref:AraC family transcriptional regulator n=1 Tax=Paenibacillus sp. LHD-117 TaxID=3071412 RepID=UPI0027DEBB2A|nr:AraC family transcriptional regulator [Paenibacillus sp. LHD-117]MDQ6422753.1 AraC family transcriptional regulator [Paenibacillus sp. LHD-117]
MTVQRTIEHYEDDLYFRRHPDIYVLEAEENLWLAEHDHDFVEIVLVTEGKGTHYVNGEPLQTERGDLFAIPVGTRHIFRPPARTARSERLKVLNCLIRTASLSRLAAFLGDERATGFLSWLAGQSSAERPYLHLKDETGELRGLFERLHRVYAANAARAGEADSLSLWSGALGLLASVFRQAAGTEEETCGGGRLPQPGAGGESDFRARRALAYIRQHFADPIRAFDAAAAVGIGERQLGRLLASTTGRSFRRHLEDIRVEACCRLLRDSRIPIMALPPMVGYEKWKSLDRIFRDRMGMSLREYRKFGRNDSPK